MSCTAGRSFLSYRRARSSEAMLLIEAQHNIGVPTWQDVTNLREEQTENALKGALRSPQISNAVLLITPEIVDSKAIQDIEIPFVLDRLAKDPSFFVVPALAGGTDYADIPKLITARSTINALSEWNVRKITNDPLAYADALALAASILTRRIELLHQELPIGKPIDLGFYTVAPPPVNGPHHLVLDWSSHFRNREACQQVWDEKLIPALHLLSEALRKHATSRPILASGHPCIPATVALGTAFLEPRRQYLVWDQFTSGKTSQWSLREPSSDSGFRVRVEPAEISGRDMAVLVSVSTSVVPAFSRLNRRQFRCIVNAQKEGKQPHIIATPNEAVQLCRLVLEAIKEARNEYKIEIIHLFLAVPVGVAVMMGQLLNTNGEIYTYEHIPSDSDGVYAVAARLRPSMPCGYKV